MKKVLIANIFGIGDVLFTTPLIANLKKSIEGVSVDYLCNARTREVLEMVPDVDDIYIYEKDDLVRSWNRSKTRCLKELYGLFSAIRGKRYDAVFDFTLSRKFGFFFAFAGIRKRVGFDYKHRGAFLTDRIELKGFEGRHVIEHYLDLLEKLGLGAAEKEMQLVPDQTRLERVQVYLREKAIGGKKLVAVIPGGGASWGPNAPRKRWTAKGFSRVADALSAGGAAVAILGDSSERELCREVAAGMDKEAAFVENALPLKDYMTLISRCDLVLCNDGGPLHIAVALGVKSVSIFGPVDEAVYGPYPPSARHRVIKRDIPCRPCYGRFRLPECGFDTECLDGISPERVAEECLQLLGK